MAIDKRKQRCTRDGSADLPVARAPAQPADLWFERVSRLYPPRVVEWIRRVRAARRA